MGRKGVWYGMIIRLGLSVSLLAGSNSRLPQNAMTHIDNQKPKIVETLTATLPIARWTGILRGGGVVRKFFKQGLLESKKTSYMIIWVIYKKTTRCTNLYKLKGVRHVILASALHA